MTEANSTQRYLADVRLAALATSDMPAWLWNTSATHVLWANPVGAAILVGENLTRVGTQITRFAASLPPSGATRLQRLRGLGDGLGRMLLCRCSRIELTDRTPGVLVDALEPAGPPLTLVERARRLYQSCEGAVIVFARDGTPLFATSSARQFLGSRNLADLGAEQLGREAMLLGHASGRTASGPVSVTRLGTASTTVLVVTFLAPPASEAAIADVADSVAVSSETGAATGPVVAGKPAVTVERTAQIEPASAPVDAGAPILTTAPEGAVQQTTVVPLNLYADIPLDLPVASVPPSEIGDTAPSKLPLQDGHEITAAPAPIKTDIPLRERRHPLRFVWQMDLDGRFTLRSDEFTSAIGPKTAMALGRRWNEIAAELGLDPGENIARAIASRDTWSGITVAWPVDGGGERLKIELSGLPIYGSNRTFLGYRGFAVCRDIEQLAALAALRRNGPGPAVDFSAAGIPPVELQSRPTAKDESSVNSANDARPVLVLVPPAKNVVPFRAASGVEQRAPGTSEHVFRELGRQSTSHRPDDEDETRDSKSRQETIKNIEDAIKHAPAHEEPLRKHKELTGLDRNLVGHPLLEKLPVGILVYRLDQLLYANRAFLEWTGYPNLDALTEAGGLDSLFIDSGAGALRETGPERTLAIATNRGDRIPVNGRLCSVPWDGEPALALMIVNMQADDRRAATETALHAAKAEIVNLNAILDTVTDGVIVLDHDARILSANRSANALFDFGPNELQGFLGDLLAPESERLAIRYLDEVAHVKEQSEIHDGVEIYARTCAGNLIPVLMRVSRIAGDNQRFCVVLQDLTMRKRIEEELIDARHQAKQICAEQSELLAKISHEIRTPINSVVAFSELMLDERFGPIGNERYRGYLKDIGTSGAQVVSMLNDLIDLSRIETGKLTLSYVSTSLNDLVQSCVAQMQPHASRERIIIRMSLSPSLPAVSADVPSLRHIIVSLLNNSINFTSAGGQVIVSTALSDAGETVLRVRDTGIGMSDRDVEAALAPFRQLATGSTQNSIGSGLGLSLTKALAEANRARFSIFSKVGDGTLVEIAFPPTPAR